MTGGIAQVGYKYEAADLPMFQALIHLAREVHGTLDLFDAIPPRTARRILAGDVTRRDLTSYKLGKILRATCTASLVVDDGGLANRCRRAVRRFAKRAPREVIDAYFCAASDAVYRSASTVTGDEHEQLLNVWRRMIVSARL